MPHTPEDDYNEDDFFDIRPEHNDPNYPFIAEQPRVQEPLPHTDRQPRRTAQPVGQRHQSHAHYGDAPQHTQQTFAPQPQQTFAPPPAPPQFSPGQQFANPSQLYADAAPVNPLTKYFRLPGLHLTLPTKGAFFDPKDYDPTLAGEIPIFPMRAQDELLMKNPDALMSGFAIEELLKSCVPAIKNPRKVSSPDLDALLLAIRAASYGDRMEIEVDCPKCEAENSFDVHLPSIMSNMTSVDSSNEVRLSDELVVYVQPYTLETATKIALGTFDEAKKLQAAEIMEADELTMTALRNEAFKRLSQMNTRALTDSVIAVVTPEGPVLDRVFIGQFIANSERQVTALIEAKLTEINSKGIDKGVQAKCRQCEHEWTTDIEFNPSTFFG